MAMQLKEANYKNAENRLFSSIPHRNQGNFNGNISAALALASQTESRKTESNERILDLSPQQKGPFIYHMFEESKSKHDWIHLHSRNFAGHFAAFSV